MNYHIQKAAREQTAEQAAAQQTEHEREALARQEAGRAKAAATRKRKAEEAEEAAKAAQEAAEAKKALKAARKAQRKEDNLQRQRRKKAELREKKKKTTKTEIRRAATVHIPDDCGGIALSRRLAYRCSTYPCCCSFRHFLVRYRLPCSGSCSYVSTTKKMRTQLSRGRAGFLGKK